MYVYCVLYVYIYILYTTYLHTSLYTHEIRYFVPVVNNKLNNAETATVAVKTENHAEKKHEGVWP